MKSKNEVRGQQCLAERRILKVASPGVPGTAQCPDFFPRYSRVFKSISPCVASHVAISQVGTGQLVSCWGGGGGTGTF